MSTSRPATVLPLAIALALCLVPALLAAPAKPLRPPKTARIVEGLSAGGLSIGDTYTDMVALWGKPENCNSISIAGNNLNPVRCEWYAPSHGRLGDNGTLEVDLTTRTDGKVVGLQLWDEKSQPRYRWSPVLTGWKTASGIGLRSTPAAVRKAYGSRLRDVPHPEPLPPNYVTTAYLVTLRNGKRWVTSFSFDRNRAIGRQPWGPVKLQNISILSYAAFAAFYSHRL